MSHHTWPIMPMATTSSPCRRDQLGSYVLSDDLELGKDEVRAKGKGRQEGSEAKVPNDHERCVFTYKLVGFFLMRSKRS